MRGVVMVTDQVDYLGSGVRIAPPLNSEKMIEKFASENDKILLSFSRGKDSIGAWLQLLKFYKPENIFPFHLYTIPHMAWEEESVKYYEDFFKTKILQLPHPRLYRMLRNSIFQDYNSYLKIKEMKLPSFDYDFCYKMALIHYKLPETTYVAIGNKRSDNINRAMQMKKNGGIQESKNKIFPIYDWTDTFLKSEIIKSGVKLPIDYEMFGRSFDGLQFEFVEPIKSNFPDDYEKIKTWFPLIDVEIERRRMNDGY